MKTVLASTLLALVSAWPYGHGPDQLTVSTSSGRIHGKIDPALPNVRQFLGIPFAQPPLGDLRWEAPQSLSCPNEDVEAKELPPSCPQFLGTYPTIYTRDILEFNLQGLNRTGATSEDCLTASVWAPTVVHGAPGWQRSRPEPLPVLIFIYGGGFSGGGEDVPYQIPAQWVNRTPDHIVVTFNYRVNIFGYPGAPGLEEKNLGLLDQRAAVEWVKYNIASFGGDPDRIVLWGQSAGAVSVDYYNFAWPNDPIVKGLIMDSGTVFISGESGGANHTSFSYVAGQLGCAGLNSTAEVACMKKVPADTIEDFIANHANSGASPSLSFNPVSDERIIFSNYTQRALAGQLSKLPAIIGTNAQDGVAFTSEPYSPSGPSAAASQLGLLTTFFCPATETIRLRQRLQRPTYRYVYAGNFTNIAPRGWMGAYHSSELPMLMGTHPDFRGPSTSLEEATSRAMQDAWVAFARDPERGLQGVGWREYDMLGSEEVREFGGDGVAAKDVSVARLEGMCDGAKPTGT